MPRGTPDTSVNRIAAILDGAAERLLDRARRGPRRAKLEPRPRRVLTSIVYGCPKPMCSLAAGENITPQAMTTLVDGLERAGYVRRIRSAADRRVIMVSATPAGRALLDEERASRIGV
ncbi:MAG: MarR family winged helix-turn-helix transcriptional regulator, partial [Nocardioidaceae bacterium]